MINIDTTDQSITELLLNNQVDVVIHGCNCFHTMTGRVAKALNEITNGDVEILDKSFSPYADINNLGTYTNGVYTIEGKEVEIYNLYSQYTLSAPQCEPIHWESVYNGLYDIIEHCESNCVIAIGQIGQTPQGQTEFNQLLEDFAQKNDDYLPDVDILVVER